jgi:hypothetical protein
MSDQNSALCPCDELIERFAAAYHLEPAGKSAATKSAAAARRLNALLLRPESRVGEVLQDSILDASVGSE